jgi:hypothetical protein
MVYIRVWLIFYVRLLFNNRGIEENFRAMSPARHGTISPRHATVPCEMHLSVKTHPTFAPFQGNCGC